MGSSRMSTRDSWLMALAISTICFSATLRSPTNASGATSVASVGEVPPCLGDHAAAVENAAAAQLAAEKDILVDAQGVDEIELLRDHGDAEALGDQRVGNTHRLPIKEDAAAGRRIDAADQLHKGGLAGAVFADHTQ